VALCLISNIVAYCLVIKVAVTADDMKLDRRIFLFLSNVGFCIICIALVIAEFEPMWLISRASFLHYWFCRGFCYGWQGIQTEASTGELGSAVDAETQAGRNAMVTYAEVVGYILISVGLLYMIMSVACLRRIANLPSDQLLEERIAAMQSGGNVVKQKTVYHVSNSAPTTVQSEAGSRQDVEYLERLTANLATALGMPVATARSRFGGDSGAGEAAKFAKDRGSQSTVNISYVPPSTASTEVAALTVPMLDRDEDLPRRRRLDDSELEKMYYGK
jgi:hypothetical protein